MDQGKTKQWLDDHGVILEESFYTALNNLARVYQETNGIRLLEDVYLILGVKKQAVSWWKNHPYSTQTRESKKRVIYSCARVFNFPFSTIMISADIFISFLPVKEGDINPSAKQPMSVRECSNI